MTRINTVPPMCLSTPHLMAEYRELPRIFTAVIKLIEQDKTPADVDIPDSYRLGTGHVKFFYNKCSWLYNRYSSLVHELQHRGYSLNQIQVSSIMERCTNKISGTEWFGDYYEPSPEDMYLNMARLARRSKMDNVLAELSSDN